MKKTRTNRGAYLFPGSIVTGDTTLERDVSVWYHAVLRGDKAPIYVGERSNIQDNVVVHVDHGFPVTIGKDVTIGHSAVIHGCTIGDACIIGMGAIVLNGAKIGNHCLIGAGTLVPGGKEIPDGSVAFGNPVKIFRQTQESDMRQILENAQEYVENAREEFAQGEFVQGEFVREKFVSKKETATKIKICGLTDVSEVAYVNGIHADFAGMVLFCPKSKRNIEIPQAQKIMQALDAHVCKVAVVVSPTPQQIREIQEAGFDRVQIHGQVRPEVVQALEIPFLRAFNVDNMQEWEIYEKESKCAGYVFDAVQPGSGETFDWNTLPTLPEGGKPYLLAGGLDADNVAMAIGALHPTGVDVSTGVEFTTGKGKDPARILAFAASVLRADQEK